MSNAFFQLRQGHGVRIRERSGNRPREALPVLASRLHFRNRRSSQVRQARAKVAEKHLARGLALPAAVIAVVIARNAEEAVALSTTRPAPVKSQRYLMRLGREVNPMLAKESPVL